MKEATENGEERNEKSKLYCQVKLAHRYAVFIVIIVGPLSFSLCELNLDLFSIRYIAFEMCRLLSKWFTCNGVGIKIV